MQALYDTVDNAVEKIDPDWLRHAVERWEGAPADIVSSPCWFERLIK